MNLILTLLIILIWFGVGFVCGYPTSNQRNLILEAEAAITECQKDLPRSQVCELTAKIKEGKE